MNKIRLEIISPERTLLNLDVTQVILPGAAGKFGVLYGHENYIATIKPGVIEIYQDEAVTERYIVSSGIAEITAKTCIILVDEAVKVGEIDFELFESRIEEVKKDMDNQTSELVKEEIEDRLIYLEETLKFKS